MSARPARVTPVTPVTSVATDSRLRQVLAAGRNERQRVTLSTGALVPPEEAYAGDPGAYAAYIAKCVELHNLLVGAKVAKNPDCGAVVEGRPKRGAPAPIECSADGYKMGVAMDAYADKVLTPADIDYIAQQKAAINAGQLSGTNALAAHEWTTIQGSTFEEKVRFVQSLARAPVLLSPYTTLCSYGDDSQIVVSLFEDVSKKKSVKDIRPRDPSTISADGFTRELLSTAEFVILHPEQEGFVWLHRVSTPESAAALHLPWNGQEYIYLPLVCATDTFAGGGAWLMKQVTILMALMEIKTLVFSALPHVVWYYYKTMAARFVDMEFNVVDVSAFEGKPLIQPYSAAEGELKKGSFGGRPKRN